MIRDPHEKLPFASVAREFHTSSVQDLHSQYDVEGGEVGLVGGEVGASVGDVVTGLSVGCLLGVSVTGFREGLGDGAREGLEEGARVGDDVLGLEDELCIEQMRSEGIIVRSSSKAISR